MKGMVGGGVGGGVGGDIQHTHRVNVYEQQLSKKVVNYVHTE